MTRPPFDMRIRRGLPRITPKMLEVLLFLRQTKADEWPCVPLENIHGLTLNALVNRDWVFKSASDVDDRYGITARGEHALKVYEPVLRRRDGICPTCGLRPKHVSPSGRVDGYCLECGNKSKRKAYKMKRPGKNPDSLCPRCKKRSRHIYASGRPCTYCLHCKNVLNRRRKKEDRKRDAQLAQQGIVKLCARPDCTRPRHVSPSGVLDWCHEHYREWYNDYRHRKRALNPPKKGGRPRKVQVEK